LVVVVGVLAGGAAEWTVEVLAAELGRR
jgi:hypothetical protein